MLIPRLCLVACAVLLPRLAMAEPVCDDTVQKVCIETVQTGDQVVFYGENRHSLLPVTVNLELSLTNLTRTQGAAGPFVLDGNKRERLFTLTQRRNASWSYRYNFTWSRGDITARHDDSVSYRLPFPSGRSFNVGQSCDGAFTHSGAHRYAIDFNMPEGTPVHAARAGVVVSVKEDSRRGGASENYQDDGNHVIIKHADRTLGQYFHLKPNGASVRPGDRVQAGSLIGYSGNTGQSTGPHLHFDVIKGAAGIKSETVLIRFNTSRGPVRCPSRGTTLSAAN